MLAFIDGRNLANLAAFVFAYLLINLHRELGAISCKKHKQNI